MFTSPKTTLLVLALAAAFPAAAQSNAEVLKELQALRDRISQLEQQLKATQDKPAPAAAAPAGMTAAQQTELNRLTVKTEALEDSREASGFLGLKISGQMQTAYIYNQAQDLAGFQFLDSVATYGYNYWNSYIGMAIIDFQKEMTDGTKWRLTLAPQRGVGSVIDGTSVVQEASVSIPLGDLQTRLIAGQIPDWSGYEYLPPNQNKLITHNLLFDFTLPTGYIGAGLDVTSGKWVSKVMLAQLNQNANNSGQKGSVVAFRVDYARGEFQGFGLAGVLGQAPNFVNDTGNTSIGLFEVDGYFIRGDWTVQGQLSYGTQKQAAITLDQNTGAFQTASWYGLSTLAAYKITPRFEAVGRFDYINNSKNGGGLLGYGADYGNGIGPDGNLGCDVAYVVGCDKGASRYALALGVNYTLNANTMLKAEYRYDWSNLNVFQYVNDGLFRKSSNLLGASVVVSF